MTGEWWRADGAFAALHWLADARARLVPPASRPGAVLVDLGCGGGLLGARLRGRGYRVVGVDAIPASLRVAAEHGTRVLCGDAGRVPMPDGSAEVVVAGELLEHVAHPERVLAEAARLLRPGGLLVGDTIAATPLARLLLVGLAERVGVAPPGIHDPALFVAPGRVLAGCRSHRLRGAVRGLRPRVPALLRWLASGTGSVPMRPTPGLGLVYQFRAIKEAG